MSRNHAGLKYYLADAWDDQYKTAVKIVILARNTAEADYAYRQCLVRHPKLTAARRSSIVQTDNFQIRHIQTVSELNRYGAAPL